MKLASTLPNHETGDLMRRGFGALTTNSAMLFQGTSSDVDTAVTSLGHMTESACQLVILVLFGHQR